MVMVEYHRLFKGKKSKKKNACSKSISMIQKDKSDKSDSKIEMSIPAHIPL